MKNIISNANNQITAKTHAAALKSGNGFADVTPHDALIMRGNFTPAQFIEKFGSEMYKCLAWLFEEQGSAAHVSNHMSIAAKNRVSASTLDAEPT